MAAHSLAIAATTPSPSPVVAARQLAEAGVPVFVCVPGGKRPLPGSRGFLDATTDPAQIDAWWRRVPDANLAIPTGHMSGPLWWMSMSTASTVSTLSVAPALPGCCRDR